MSREREKGVRDRRRKAIRPDALAIVPPLVPGTCEDLVRVVVSSTLAQRRAVYRLACFFRRESHYDFVQYGYEGRETDPDHVAFLWVHPDASISDDDWLVPCVGACCFRWREWEECPAGWALQWAWMHPFFRRRGLLSRAWPAFRREFGDFVTEPPLSDAMKAFLAGRGECWRCGRVCRCERQAAVETRASLN